MPCSEHLEKADIFEDLWSTGENTKSTKNTVETFSPDVPPDITQERKSAGCLYPYLDLLHSSNPRHFGRPSSTLSTKPVGGQ